MHFEANIGGERMTERHGRLLAAFSERAARLAAELADRAMAAEDASEAADLSRAFHAVGRSLRQAIALEQRLERDAAKAQRQAADEAAKVRHKAVEARCETQRAALKAAAWTEIERMDFVLEPDSDYTPAEARRIWYADRCHEIDMAIDEAAGDAAAFLAEPADAQFERLANAILGEAAPEPDEASSADSS